MHILNNRLCCIEGGSGDEGVPPDGKEMRYHDHRQQSVSCLGITSRKGKIGHSTLFYKATKREELDVTSNIPRLAVIIFSRSAGGYKFAEVGICWRHQVADNSCVYVCVVIKRRGW